MIKKFYTLTLLLSCIFSLNAQTFNNTAAIAMASLIDSEPASLYPSPISVTGTSGTITSVSVKLNNVTHAYPEDISIVLQAPNGTKLMLQNGSIAALSNNTYTLADVGATFLPDVSGNIVNNATYKPSANLGGDNFPAPGPGVIYFAPGPLFTNNATFASVFNGLPANGTWNLWVIDVVSGDAGTIAGGWNLTVVTSGLPLSINNVSDFTGKCTDNSNLLSWFCANPKENSSFSVEKLDNITNEYISIGEILISENNTKNAFEFIDLNPGNTSSTYRIKSNKLSNTISYSNSTIVNCYNNNSIIVLPNPSQDYIKIVNLAKSAKVEIVSLDGTVIKQFERVTNNISLDIRNLVKANYIVRVTSNGTTTMHKFFKN
jgi:subtilisin-like proprotein convertase family protein